MQNAMCDHLAAWSQFFTRVTQVASESLTLWTNGDVSMSLCGVRETTLTEAGAELGLSESPSTVVQLGIDGAFQGQLILAFEEPHDRALMRSLLGQRATNGEQWSPLELSAFAETGNIIASIYLNHLSELTNCRLWPTPPETTRDYAVSIVEQALAFQAFESDRIVVFETRFECGGQKAPWIFIFVPTPELLARIENELGR